MNIDTTTKVFSPSHNQPGTHVNGAKSKGGNQPPKNMMDASADRKIILAYSPRKNRAKPIPEYSTIGPATISDSPSPTSKGWRLASATAAMAEHAQRGR